MKSVKNVTKKSSVKKVKVQLHNPAQLVCISGGVCFGKMHKDEGGPDAWIRTPFDCPALNAGDVLRACVSALSEKPTYRHLTGFRVRVVIVMADKDVTEDDKRKAVSHSAFETGTQSEAQRLVNKVQWIAFPTNSTKEEMAVVMANEVQARRANDDTLDPCDTLFVLWKSQAGSFEGAALLEIGLHICHSVFTVGTATVPAFLDEDDDQANRWKVTA
ncbi:MAG: hypothetical protein ABI273_15015 [Lacunisphaera sp.]